MINVNILNNLIKGISEQIPLVNSYYTTSPYESWNVEEVKYGSVSFVITKVYTRETTTTFDATIYYADRLLEDNSNRDFVHSDAATVIQTIVGALNTADEYLEVSYPVGITLFEQDFADKLAGGYAQVSISAEGMGECFEDEFSVPEIIATSAYFTKEEIKELFPLKTELSAVAFSGQFSDLLGTPNFVNIEQYTNTIEGLREETDALRKGLDTKVDNKHFENWSENIKNQFNDTPTYKDFESLTQAVIDSTSSIASELEQKVSVDYFDGWADGIEADLASRPTMQNFDTLRNDIIDKIETVKKPDDSKVGSSYFETWKEDVNTAIANAPTLQQYNNLKNEVDTYSKVIDSKADKTTLDNLSNRLDDTKSELQTAINSKADKTALDNALSTIPDINKLVTKQEFNNLTEAVAQSTSSLASELDKKLNVTYFDGWADGIEAAIDRKVSQQSFDNAFSNVYNKTQTYSKSEIDKKLDNVVIEGDINLSNYYTKTEVDDIISNIDTSDIDLSDYAKKTDVYTKTQTYTRAQIDSKLSNVTVDLSNYPTKSEIKESYYTKSEIDDKIDNIESGGGTIDLSNYYKKSETYNKTEVDTIVGDISAILNNILYTK